MEKVIKEHKYTVDELALIGDKKSDIGAGARLRVETYLVLTGYGKEHRALVNANFVAPDLLNAVQHIVNR
jgi:histidinol phosphatase-like enzyme